MFENLDTMSNNLDKSTSDQCQRFIDLYQKWQSGLTWNAQQMKKGVNISSHLTRFNDLERKIDKMWVLFSQREQLETLKIMKERKILPEKLFNLIDIYEAEVVNLTAEAINVR